MSQTVELKVRMSCQGCAGAVKRVLGKMEAISNGTAKLNFAVKFAQQPPNFGVDSFDIDMEKQKVTVIGNVQPEAVLQTVSKTGKATSFWEADKPPAAEPPAAEVSAAAEPESKGAALPETKPAETLTAA